MHQFVCQSMPCSGRAFMRYKIAAYVFLRSFMSTFMPLALIGAITSRVLASTAELLPAGREADLTTSGSLALLQ